MAERTVAFYNVMAGRAVVLCAGDTSFTLEIDARGNIKGPTQIEDGFNLNMWLQPAESHSVDEEIGEHPFEGLQKLMLHKHQLNQLIMRLTTSISGKMSAAARRMAASQFDDIYDECDSDVTDELRRIALETPIPEGCSTRDAPFPAGGHGASLLSEMVVRWGHVEPDRHPHAIDPS